MDLSVNSLEISAKKSVYSLLSKWNFNQTPYPFPDNTFDGVTCISALTYCTELPEVFAEWTRITKPGAVIVVSHRDDDMVKDHVHFDRMEATAKWRKLRHVKGQPFLPKNSNYGSDILVEYYAAKNIKKVSRL